MTWEEWINTEYNPEYAIYNGGVWNNTKTSKLQFNEVDVQSNELILRNANYLLKYVGGGSSD